MTFENRSQARSDICDNMGHSTFVKDTHSGFTMETESWTISYDRGKPHEENIQVNEKEI